MNSEIITAFNRILPLEIVAEIETHLLAAYRKEIAGDIARIINTFVSRQEGTIRIGEKIYIENTEYCGNCGELRRSSVYHFVMVPKNNYPRVSSVAPRMRCKC